ncbi:ATP-binding cassette domain-containing protein [Paeniglutamicibacter sp. ZC-3]|uniref:ATP-binding cassette domain-containing protein n=1 Tax=Paeniglutamicibacter sp. ZC-3 TaxID=2986919 RepID=UPI0021F7B8F5|nr:ATP-binding cassette domain-containing protein [Paeniglutamicibacter sp. ZC-3]MCV9994855.1 ATP-binding cassette domain-containing protein [Paeniglutamicibacter sp. ZC-3]
MDARQEICLLGPTGSGKSTFLRYINHLERFDGGRIKFDGEPIGYGQRNGKLHETKPREVAQQRRGIGMVFQHLNLFPHLTALVNIIAAPIGIRKIPKSQVIVRAH